MSFEGLADTLSESKKTDLAVLLNSKEKAKQALLSDPDNPAKMKAFDQARKVVDEFMKREERTGSGDAAVADEVFDLRIDAFRYLTEEKGFKLGKSKFYADLKKEEEEWVGGDGTLLKSRMNEYAFQKRLEIRPEIVKARRDLEEAQLGKAKFIEDCQTRMMASKTNREEIREERERVELDVLLKKTINRQDHELEMAGMIGALESSIKQNFQDKVLELIELVGGRRDREHEAKVFLDRIWDQTLNEFIESSTLEIIFLDAASESDSDE